MRIRYFPGLNGLRFIAAFFVLISHVHHSAVKVGYAIPASVIFDRGAAAVDFFFTLSGFLITYLLLQEHGESGTVSIPRFYMRRVRRIWPLYFLVLTIGFVTFEIVYPLVFHGRYFEFPAAKGLLLYILFLPNAMSAFYKVGLLNPLWSIGVEEQFYLFWAPFVKLFRRHLFPVLLAFTILLSTFHILLGMQVWDLDPRVEALFHTFRFHYMGMGALFAWALFSNADRLLTSWVTAYWFQALTLAVLIYHYTVGLPAMATNIFDLPLAIFYGSLIVNVSLGPRRWMNLEWEPLSYLGKISYGIYMLHMTLEYGLRATFLRLQWTSPSIWIGLAYGAILLLSTIVAAHFSYRYFESRFLAHAPADKLSRVPNSVPA